MPYEAVKLSQDSYESPDNNKINFNFLEAEKLGWKCVSSSDELGMSKDGYFGVAFKKGDTIVVVHRGTSPELTINSDFDDNYKILRNTVPGQYNQALKFLTAMENQYSGAFNIATTGHSLGGGLASLTGIARGIYSVPIDTPGMKGIAEQLFTPEQIANGIAKTNIFLTAPNFVNTCGEQLTFVTQLKFHTPVTSLFMVEYAYTYTKNGQHAIANIVEKAFDPETHQPIDAVRHDHWPSGLQAGYEHFVEYSLKNNPHQSFEISKNGMTREEIAAKYDININRIQEPEAIKAVGIFEYTSMHYYTILPEQISSEPAPEFSQPYSRDTHYPQEQQPESPNSQHLKDKIVTFLSDKNNRDNLMEQMKLQAEAMHPKIDADVPANMELSAICKLYNEFLGVQQGVQSCGDNMNCIHSYMAKAMSYQNVLKSAENLKELHTLCPPIQHDEL